MEDLIPVLTKFHREILVPDIERIVTASEQRLRDEMHTLFDSLAGELSSLRELFHMLDAGFKRLEERLERLEQRMDRVDARLDKLALRSELIELKSRVDGLQSQVRILEARLAE